MNMEDATLGFLVGIVVSFLVAFNIDNYQRDFGFTEEQYHENLTLCEKDLPRRFKCQPVLQFVPAEK